jgi:hypothetical protein
MLRNFNKFDPLRFLLAGLLLILSLPAASETLDLEAVLDRTMITPPSRVDFYEVRHNPMLKDDLILSGYLEYLQAGSLRKVIQDPFNEAYLIQSDRIEIERDGVTKTLSLRKSRALRTMLGGIEAILAGETEQLAAVFQHELSGEAGNWSLQLTPRSKRVARQLSSLTVTGDAEAVNAIRFELGDGEWHAMEIQHTDSSQ